MAATLIGVAILVVELLAGIAGNSLALLADAGLKCIDLEGIAWSPTRGLHLSDDMRLNYLVSAVRA